MMSCACLALALSGVADTLAVPANDTVPAVTVGGFVDVYYAWDTGRPRTMDRSFTTQPARHNEFNVNLAFVELALTHRRVRGRLAVQAGTSVQSN